MDKGYCAIHRVVRRDFQGRLLGWARLGRPPFWGARGESNDGGRSLAFPWEPHWQAHLVDRQLQTSQQVGVVTVVGLGRSPQGTLHGGRGLRQVGPMGPPEVVLRPCPPTDPLLGYGHLPQVPQPVEPHAAIPPWPPQHLCVGVEGCTGDLLGAPYHQRLICLLDGGRGVVYAGRSEQLWHDVQAARRWGFICPRISALTAEMLRGAVGFPCKKISVPMYQRTGDHWSSVECRMARSLASRVSVTQVDPTCASTACKAGDCRDMGSRLEPCWTFLPGTETCSSPWE